MAFTTDTELLDGGRLLPLVEDFYTIQGEGFHAGKPAYFIRLGGCDVGCRWCDAKYTWNPKLYPPTDVRTVIDRATGMSGAGDRHHGRRAAALSAGRTDARPCTRRGCRFFWRPRDRTLSAVYFDWVCLSPKRQQPPLDEALASGRDELKVIVESEGDFEWAERNAARVRPESACFTCSPNGASPNG